MTNSEYGQCAEYLNMIAEEALESGDQPILDIIEQFSDWLDSLERTS